MGIYVLIKVLSALFDPYFGVPWGLDKTGPELSLKGPHVIRLMI